MRKLQDGVAKFRRDTFQQKQQLFEKLSGGQHPQALFITCSDSRIVPELITHTEPGDLFVLRNAGNIVPSVDSGVGEAATIEYAIRALKIPDVVVCGHAQCGAMSAVINPDLAQGLPLVGRWLEQTGPLLDRVRSNHPDASDTELLDLLIQENVRAQLANLMLHPAVREAVDAGKLNLHGWVYSIASGEVCCLEPKGDQFVDLLSLDANTQTA